MRGVHADRHPFVHVLTDLGTHDKPTIECDACLAWGCVAVTLTPARTQRLPIRNVVLRCVVMWGIIFSRDKRLAFVNSIHLSEMEMNRPKVLCRCSCSGVIKNKL